MDTKLTNLNLKIFNCQFNSQKDGPSTSFISFKSKFTTYLVEDEEIQKSIGS